MITRKYGSVGSAYASLLPMVFTSGSLSDTRNGFVSTLDCPILVEFTDPQNNILLDPDRDANPFFHIMEVVWMLAGRNDLEFITKFNKQMSSYSDNGVTQPAAYGHRWFNWPHYGKDINQVGEVVKYLRDNPSGRRACIAMWDPVRDGSSLQKSNDVPCNTTIYFRVNAQGSLDMTVCNRSNDLVWGMLGANNVHMSFLHMVVAESLALPLGSYYHLSNDLHIYQHHWPLKNSISRTQTISQEVPKLLEGEDPNDGLEQLLVECNNFCDSILADEPLGEYRSPLIREIAIPMYNLWKTRSIGLSDHEGLSAYASAWLNAGEAWVARRAKK